MTIDDLRPSDFTHKFPWSSIRNKSEIEQNVYHIMHVRAMGKNEWNITYKEYSAICKSKGWIPLVKDRFDDYFSEAETVVDTVAFCPGWKEHAKEVISNINKLKEITENAFEVYQSVLLTNDPEAIDKATKIYKLAIKNLNDYVENQKYQPH